MKKEKEKDLGIVRNPDAYPNAVFHLNGEIETISGMTLLDYFAGQVVPVIHNGTFTKPEDIAKEAYAIAQAMLKERSKTKYGL